MLNVVHFKYYHTIFTTMTEDTTPAATPAPEHEATTPTETPAA